MPIPKKVVRELAEAHAKLDDPATGAIWIKQDATEAWLVEIIPSMSDDERAAAPTYFNPGITFRFPVALIAGNLRSLRRALELHPRLARQVADGEVFFGEPARRLVKLAQTLAKAA